MKFSPEVFYPSVLAAGAILAGFCGTFLSFRIQREAGYYRQVALDYETARAKDIYVGLSNFSRPFTLLVLATLFSLVFGVAIPLLTLRSVQWMPAYPSVVVAGLLAAIVFLVGYFICELVHYQIAPRKLMENTGDRTRERWVLWTTLAIALGVVVIAFLP